MADAPIYEDFDLMPRATILAWMNPNIVERSRPKCDSHLYRCC